MYSTNMLELNERESCTRASLPGPGAHDVHQRKALAQKEGTTIFAQAIFHLTVPGGVTNHSQTGWSDLRNFAHKHKPNIPLMCCNIMYI